MKRTRRVIFLAAFIGLEIIIGLMLWRWHPENAGITIEDGVMYEHPRVDDPARTMTGHFEKLTFDTGVDGQKAVLTYYLHKPAVQPGQTYPLVMVLHGRQGHAYAAEHLVDGDMARDHPAYVLIPTTPISRAWAVPGAKDSPYAVFADHQSLPHAVDILKKIMHENPVDPSRVYIAGCSEGGLGVFGAVLRYPDIFAGAAALSGTWDVNEAANMVKVPLWVAHGKGDPYLPVATTRAIVDSIKSHGGTVTYTEFPDIGHYCPDPRFYGPELWQWLFAQKKAG